MTGVHLDIRVALHDFLDPRQGEGRVTVIWGFLFRSINLTPPKGREELLQVFSWLNKRFLLLAHVAPPPDVIDLELEVV